MGFVYTITEENVRKVYEPRTGSYTYTVTGLSQSFKIRVWNPIHKVSACMSHYNVDYISL